jgi:hypothetical protein
MNDGFGQGFSIFHNCLMRHAGNVGRYKINDFLKLKIVWDNSKYKKCIIKI